MHFFVLSRKFYLLLAGDWMTLQMHLISTNTAEGRAKRDFFAGEYEEKYQNLLESFAQVEKAIIDLETSPTVLARCSISKHTPLIDACHVSRSSEPYERL